MKKNMIKIAALVATAVFVSIISVKDVKAYDPNRVIKIDGSVTDTSLMSFGAAYDKYIPATIKMAFESEGGMIYIIPHNMVDSRINLSGWAGGSLSSVTGYLDPNGGNPKIYCNSKVVDNANSYNAGTSDKVIVHEFGHYVCLEANKIRNGRYSYSYSNQMQQAFQTEYTGYLRTPSMSAVLKSSFERNTSISEFYANVFAAMILDPVNAQVAFPNCCALINEDIAQINAKYASAVQQQEQAAQQAQALQAQQIAQAQALQAQQAAAYQAAQAQALAIQQAQAQALAAAQAQALALQQAQMQMLQQQMQMMGQ